MKLDPSLIADIEESEKARVIVQAVMQLIKGVDCEIVAEAVETSAQADILRAMGCHTIQGYVFAEPMFEHEYLAWTRDARFVPDRRLTTARANARFRPKADITMQDARPSPGALKRVFYAGSWSYVVERADRSAAVRRA